MRAATIALATLLTACTRPVPSRVERIVDGATAYVCAHPSPPPELPGWLPEWARDPDVWATTRAVLMLVDACRAVQP